MLGYREYGWKTGLRHLISFLKEMRYNSSVNAIFLLRYCYVYQDARGIWKYLRTHYYLLLVNRYGIHLNLDKNASIGKALFLPHPTSIVFGDGVNIGDNCIHLSECDVWQKSGTEIVWGGTRYP